MKKIYQFLIVCFITFLLAGCNNSKLSEIDQNTWTSSEGLSAEKTFNKQVEETQYIKDLEDFLSYNILLTTEDKPFVSDVSLTANFDEKSSIQGGIDFSEKKYSKSHDLEDMEIDFDVRTEGSDDLEPFYASGSLSLVYQNNEMYANIHDFGVFMGEGDMLAKMYTLLGDSLIDKWIDLEAHSGGVVVLNEKEDIKLQYILGTLKSVLKTEGVNEDSPNFLNGVVELLDTINFHVDLGISTNNLSLQSVDSIKYFELKNGIIQKEFVGKFQGSESAFDLSFISSKEGLKVHLYNIKRYAEDTMDYLDTDYEISFSIQENSKSDYAIKFQSGQSKQAVVDIDGNLKYNKEAKFSGKFVLEPQGLAEGQKVSGRIEGKIIKKSPTGDEIIHEVSGETISLTSILSSL